MSLQPKPSFPSGGDPSGGDPSGGDPSGGAPPLISVVTICLNNSHALQRTFQSVLEQSYPHVEHIVIDGGSKDGTLEVIRQHQTHLKYWISEPDQGIYDAINKGLAQATGELVNILNSGDCYAEGILKTVSDHYRMHRFQMTLCDYVWVYPGTPDRQIRISSAPQIIAKGYAVCHQALFYQRQLHEELGNYDPTYPLAADYHFTRKVYERYGVEKIPQTACYYEMGGISEMAFMQYAQEVRQICHHLQDPFWKVEWTYWSKYFKFITRQTLHRLGLESVLSFYRRLKYSLPLR